MPTKAKTAKTTRRRTRVKDLPRAAEELSAKQAKRVKGGILTANPEEEPAGDYGGAPAPDTNIGTITKTVTRALGEVVEDLGRAVSGK